MNGAELTAWASGELLASDLDLDQRTAALEAQILLEHCTGWSREQCILRRHEAVGAEAADCLRSLVSRRRLGEPVAYLTGTKEFYSIALEVTPAVLIPRPETELVVDQALRLLAAEPGPVGVVDVGVGSGAILLALLDALRARGGMPAAGSRWFGIDKSREALDVASRNAARLGFADQVELLEGELLDPLPEDNSIPRWLILSNPPYVPDEEALPREVECFEPKLALRGGKDGLDVVRALLPQAWQRIVSAGSGAVVLEIGLGQHHAVESLAREAGAARCAIIRDYSGIDRIFVAEH